MQKANKLKIFPNSIKFLMISGEEVFFTSFLSRDHCYELISTKCAELQSLETELSMPSFSARNSDCFHGLELLKKDHDEELRFGSASKGMNTISIDL